MKNCKNPKQLERYFKGAANHWRIKILLLVNANPDITVDKITESLDGNFKTISHHTNKLVGAGLMNKHYVGTNVAHTLSPYGKLFVPFFSKF